MALLLSAVICSLECEETGFGEFAANNFQSRFLVCVHGLSEKQVNA